MGATASRLLNPLSSLIRGLVAKLVLAVWYVVARSRGKPASFRAERILNPRLLATRFERPTNFDLDDYWEESVRRYEATAKPVRVTVAADRGVLQQLAVLWPLQEQGECADGRIKAEVTFPLEGLALKELLTWSAEVETLSPASLREAILLRLQRGLTLHGSRQQPVG